MNLSVIALKAVGGSHIFQVHSGQREHGQWMIDRFLPPGHQLCAFLQYCLILEAL